MRLRWTPAARETAETLMSAPLAASVVECGKDLGSAAFDVLAPDIGEASRGVHGWCVFLTERRPTFFDRQKGAGT